MAEMFKNMGMSVDIEQLKSVMNQFRTQFDSMGIDPERLAKGDVNFNFDLSNLMKCTLMQFVLRKLNFGKNENFKYKELYFYIFSGN